MAYLAKLWYGETNMEVYKEDMTQKPNFSIHFLIKTFFNKGCLPKKKIAEKETLVHSHLPPSLPSLNGTRGMGT